MVNNKNVDISCKTIRKTVCKVSVSFRVKLSKIISFVYNYTFSHTFPTFSTHFPTTHTSLFLSKIFHYSTDPTNITINNFIERN